MTDSFVPISAPTVTSQKLDSEELIIGANTIQRERVQVSGAAATEIARVKSSDATGAEMGLVVRPLQTAPGNLQGYVGGLLAHGVADTQRPVKVGHKAIAFGANPAEVDASDVSDWYTSRQGIPWILGGHPNIITLVEEFTIAETNALLFTVAAGNKIIVTRLDVNLDAETSEKVSWRVGFSTSAAPPATGVGALAKHGGMVPGEPYHCGNGGGILGIGAADEDLRLVCDRPTNGKLTVGLSLFTIAEA